MESFLKIFLLLWHLQTNLQSNSCTQSTVIVTDNHEAFLSVNYLYSEKNFFTHSFGLYAALYLKTLPTEHLLMTFWMLPQLTHLPVYQFCFTFVSLRAALISLVLIARAPGIILNIVGYSQAYSRDHSWIFPWHFFKENL